VDNDRLLERCARTCSRAPRPRRIPEGIRHACEPHKSTPLIRTHGTGTRPACWVASCSAEPELVWGIIDVPDHLHDRKRSDITEKLGAQPEDLNFWANFERNPQDCRVRRSGVALPDAPARAYFVGIPRWLRRATIWESGSRKQTLAGGVGRNDLGIRRWLGKKPRWRVGSRSGFGKPTQSTASENQLGKSSRGRKPMPSILTVGRFSTAVRRESPASRM